MVKSNMIGASLDPGFGKGVGVGDGIGVGEGVDSIGKHQKQDGQQTA